VLVGHGLPAAPGDRVAKYAHAVAAEVTLRVADRWAEIIVDDDGVGGANAKAGGGLREPCDRGGARRPAEAHQHAVGTTVGARVPLTSGRIP
jgi:hypothetical protein